MNNEKNMGPIRSSDEARKQGRNGGIASGKSRRQKKEVRERLKEALNRAVVNPKVKSMMKQGIPPACGENCVDVDRHAVRLQDSPRMRGKLALPIGMSLQPWITPAHAGKTHIHQDKIRGLWDHPRTCGENVSIHSQNLLHSGSPPRVRGNSTTFLCTKSITSSVRNFRLNQHFCFLHIQTKQKVFRVNQRAINAWR